MADKSTAGAESAPGVGHFNLLAQHLQPQPLVLDCGQVVMGNGERFRRRAEFSRVTCLEVSVGQDIIQLGDLRL